MTDLPPLYSPVMEREGSSKECRSGFGRESEGFVLELIQLKVKRTGDVVGPGKCFWKQVSELAKGQPKAN